MIALAIDTCGPSGSVALGRVEPGDLTLLAETELPGKSYAAQLVPVMRAMLTAEGLDAAILQAIVVVNGPGSFTGIRVGVSTAKGLAQALDLPLLAVSRLAVLASKARTPAAALNAGRSELYFRDGQRETLIPAKSALRTAPGSLAVCEPDVHWLFPDALLTPPPNAADALRFAAPRLL
ncbi:MAG: tRNA (adenosine(37)-N6)-threonylcarbamoyltransferase complex dimerization subunit type 1 TsaB, partial [Acidobacteriaceae bacterium]